MAKVFTQEEREKIKWQVVELVRQSGRETLRQLEAKTGATRYLMSVLARELVASGDVYNSGYGLSALTLSQIFVHYHLQTHLFRWLY